MVSNGCMSRMCVIKYFSPTKIVFNFLILLAIQAVSIGPFHDTPPICLTCLRWYNIIYWEYIGCWNIFWPEYINSEYIYTYDTTFCVFRICLMLDLSQASVGAVSLQWMWGKKNISLPKSANIWQRLKHDNVYKLERRCRCAVQGAARLRLTGSWNARCSIFTLGVFFIKIFLASMQGAFFTLGIFPKKIALALVYFTSVTICRCLQRRRKARIKWWFQTSLQTIRSTNV